MNFAACLLAAVALCDGVTLVYTRLAKVDSLNVDLVKSRWVLIYDQIFIKVIIEGKSKPRNKRMV